jgi:6,7-dimethyl-8-ribityllumazine synthase
MTESVARCRKLRPPQSEFRNCMPTVYQGSPAVPPGHLAIVVSRYNESVTSRLLEGAQAALRNAGVAEEAIEIAWVPGAFEIPLVADRMANSGRYAAVLCLGAVIRGETTHDQHINRAVSLQLTESSVHAGIPILFGILTCDTLEQAIHRSGGNVGNKGAECAAAALEMIDLMRQLP